MNRLTNGPTWWVFLLVLGLALLAVALYYQYVLDYPPCVLCIHVRMLVAAVVLLSVAMLWLRRRPLARLVGHVLAAAAWLFLAERSWQLLGTERGWVFGSCDMRSGLPDWLALEDWLPWLFRIHEPCGYTPELVGGVTMAEGLVGISWTMSVIALALVLATLVGLRRNGSSD